MMGVEFFSTNSKTVLTDEGLFLKRPGDLLNAVEYLNQEGVFSEVLDTEFAVLWREFQRQKIESESCCTDCNQLKTICRMMKNKTLQNSLNMSYTKTLSRAQNWEILLRMDVAGGVFSELVKRFGQVEAKRRHGVKCKSFLYHERQVEGNYTFTFGLFFNTREDLLKAEQLLSLQGLEGVRISTEVALTAFYLQETIKDKEIGSFNLLEIAEKLSKDSTGWRESLRRQIKYASKKNINYLSISAKRTPTS